MRRNDFILIAALIIFAMSPIFFVSGEKKIAVVKVDGKIFREINLSAEEIFTIESGGGKNIVEVKNNSVAVIEADCADKICVQSGTIKNVGEVIACVPHKILIEIVGD